MIEKMMKKIANTQEFFPDDRLGQMVKECDGEELELERLDQVFAARADERSYADFLKLARQRDLQRK